MQGLYLFLGFPIDDGDHVIHLGRHFYVAMASTACWPGHYLYTLTTSTLSVLSMHATTL